MVTIFRKARKIIQICDEDIHLNLIFKVFACPRSRCPLCAGPHNKWNCTVVSDPRAQTNKKCPNCPEVHPRNTQNVTKKNQLTEKFQEFNMFRETISVDVKNRDRSVLELRYAVIASGCAGCPKLKCERPGCESYFCYHCKAEWHPNQTCDMARAQRSPNIILSSFNYLHDIQNNDDVKSCPRCQVLIMKMDDGSCNHMTCSVCGAEFCWLCMKEISDLHYLSPSGCTFWGKKPWSRKKKILWQLGTLVGAPLGIGLVAGLAVPAMIIGIPIWVGRKLHARYATSNRHRRNIAIVGGVTASALISPVLAGLAVSIGVPILLAYVYGVVPISLCRSGGCGVTTSASGVRIAFDDENDMVFGIPGRQSESSHVGGGTASIGEVSCGASLSADSAAHILTGESDRESASNTAIAPASLTASIASSCISRSHSLEIHVCNFVIYLRLCFFCLSVHVNNCSINRKNDRYPANMKLTNTRTKKLESTTTSAAASTGAVCQQASQTYTVVQTIGTTTRTASTITTLSNGSIKICMLSWYPLPNQANESNTVFLLPEAASADPCSTIWRLDWVSNPFSFNRTQSCDQENGVFSNNRNCLTNYFDKNIKKNGGIDTQNNVFFEPGADPGGCKMSKTMAGRPSQPQKNPILGVPGGKLISRGE
ncbi:unnamed protein product, partial [Meganyctiphanes norvegica]